MVPTNLTVVLVYTDLGLLVGHQIKTDSDAIIAKNLVTLSETVYRELKIKPELETAIICVLVETDSPQESHYDDSELFGEGEDIDQLNN